MCSTLHYTAPVSKQEGSAREPSRAEPESVAALEPERAQEHSDDGSDKIEHPEDGLERCAAEEQQPREEGERRAEDPFPDPFGQIPWGARNPVPEHAREHDLRVALHVALHSENDSDPYGIVQKHLERSRLSTDSLLESLFIEAHRFLPFLGCGLSNTIHASAVGCKCA